MPPIGQFGRGLLRGLSSSGTGLRVPLSGISHQVNDVSRQGAFGGLSRPREGRLVAGVCAGLAERFDLPRFIVRALFVASMLLPGPQILAYVALWVVVPDEGANTA